MLQFVYLTKSKQNFKQLRQAGFLSGIALVALFFMPLNPSYAEEESSFVELLNVLDKQTKLVTKTRINADFVPGSITLLSQKDMKQYGARTLKEALDLTPSIEVQHNHLGHSIIVMRGLGTPFAGGMLKFMLNGKPLMSTAGGYAEGLLNMPLHQVERLEIIRGASSVLHGEFAFAGVINLVTKHQDTVSISAGNMGYRGFNAAREFSAASEMSLGLDVSHYQAAKSGVVAETDILTMAGLAETGDPGLDALLPTLPAFSKAPKTINDRKEFNGFGMTFGKEALRFELRAHEYKTGDYYGAIEFMPDETRDYNQEITDVSFALSGAGELKQSLAYNWNLSYRQHSWLLNSFWTSTDIPDFIGTPYKAYAYRTKVRSLNGEENINFNYDLIATSVKNHRFLIGVDLASFKINQSDFSYCGRSDTPACGIEEDVIRKSFMLGAKNDRHLNLAVYLQDEWKFLQNFILTAGLRVEKTWSDYASASSAIDFNDLEKISYAPKIALVYKLSDTQVLKAQVSQSLILPPVFQSINDSRENPYKAKTDHLELSYNYHGNAFVARVTGFYSEFEQMPRGTVYYRYFTEAPTSYGDWEGLDEIKSYGVELDSVYRFSPNLSGLASLTLLETKDKNSGTILVGTAKETAKLGLSYDYKDLWNISGFVRHLGKRYREPYDARKPLDAYTVADFGASYKGLAKGLDLGFYVKNLADAKVYAPSPINGTLSEIHGEPKAAFHNDLLLPGRQLWLELSYTP